MKTMTIHPSNRADLASRLMLLLAVVVAVTSCRDTPIVAPPAGATYAVSFSPAAPVAGSIVTVTAQLVDADGTPVRLAGRVVKWSSSNGGLISPATSTTTSDGIATTSTILPGHAGNTYRITATDDRGMIGTSQPFTSLAGPPAQYAVTAPKNATAGSTIAIIAQLADRNGNPLGGAGRVVTWSVASSGSGSFASGSFAVPTSATDANGIATVNFTLGVVANQSYVIIANDNQAIYGATAALRATPGAASRYVVAIDSSETDPPVGALVTIVAQLSDANGNPVFASSLVVTWTFTGTGATLSSTASTTDPNGAARVLLTTSTVAGASYTVSAGDRNGFQGTTSTITTQPQVSLASIVTGFESSSGCGTSTTGTAWCWGLNNVGQLGNGTTVSRSVPGRSAGNLNLASVTVGSSFACGLTPAGAAYCWGNNAEGELGDNSIASPRTVPVPVASSIVFQTLSAGRAHVCGVAANGDAYCWGNNTTGEVGASSAGPVARVPVKVEGGLSFVAISAGANYTCGIITTGDAYCWGFNSDGQLGDGSVTTRLTPVLVAGGLQFTALSTGLAHTCGISAGGSASCWGNNNFGQLGTGTAFGTNRTPQATAGGLTFSAIAAGGLHTCAIATGGSAYCWGDNSQEELGSAAPPTGASQPLAVSGDLQFTSITAAGSVSNADSYYYYNYYYYTPTFDSHSCGITTGGSAYCWGSNNGGQLGVGVRTSTSGMPFKVAGQR